VGSVARLVASSGLVLGLSVLVTVQPAFGAARHAVSHTTTTTIWTPTLAPLPASLPDGRAPEFANLYSTSCSSTSFCVAVGEVQDSIGNVYPLIETGSGNTWAASIAPLPANADSSSPTDILNSVSCSTGGTCVAVGVYVSANPSSQPGLLETYSGGTWTASEAPGSSSLTLTSVSCADSKMCMAVGTIDTPDAPVGDQVSAGIYTFDSGTWQQQAAPPLPSDYTFPPVPEGYSAGISVNSVSCPDESDCVVVGDYTTTAYYTDGGNSLLGLIDTYSSGNWSVEASPLPTNANTTPADADLDAVDCISAEYCVAGGTYARSVSPGTGIPSPGSFVPLLEAFQSGVWSPSQGPLPPDAAPQPSAGIEGISCTAADECMADGIYTTSSSTSGLLLTQSGSGWSAVSAPVPVTPFVLRGSRASSTANGVSLHGVSCMSTTFCRAVGKDGKRPLIERMGKAPRR